MKTLDTHFCNKTQSNRMGQCCDCHCGPALPTSGSTACSVTVPNDLLHELVSGCEMLRDIYESRKTQTGFSQRVIDKMTAAISKAKVLRHDAASGDLNEPTDSVPTLEIPLGAATQTQRSDA